MKPIRASRNIFKLKREEKHVIANDGNIHKHSGKIQEGKRRLEVQVNQTM